MKALFTIVNAQIIPTGDPGKIYVDRITLCAGDASSKCLP